MSKHNRPSLIIAFWHFNGWNWRAYWYDDDGKRVYEESGGFDGRRDISSQTIATRARRAAGHGGSRVPVEIRS